MLGARLALRVVSGGFPLLSSLVLRVAGWRYLPRYPALRSLLDSARFVPTLRGLARLLVPVRFHRLDGYVYAYVG
jgi:hypothetical protein